MIKNFMLVGLGGGLGSMLRYACQRWLSASCPQAFPWGTFSVNLTGCLLIGLLWGCSIRNAESSEPWKLLLMTGLCGGFTTFSAFTLESIGLLKENRWPLFLAYVSASVMLGLLATFAGMKMIR